MLERHKLLMGRTQDRAGQNNGSIGVFWRSFNGIIGHIRYMFRAEKITHNHGHSSLYQQATAQVRRATSSERAIARSLARGASQVARSWCCIPSSPASVVGWWG